MVEIDVSEPGTRKSTSSVSRQHRRSTGSNSPQEAFSQRDLTAVADGTNATPKASNHQGLPPTAYGMTKRRSTLSERTRYF